jgi:hypothetical protein
VSADGILFELRNGVLAIRRFRLDHGNILGVPVDDATGVRATGLKAGASVKDDHDVFAQVAGLLFLPFAKPLSGGHHQDDGDDAPGDPEHGQKGSQLVRPKRAKYVENQVFQRHDRWLDGAARRR